MSSAGMPFFSNFGSHATEAAVAVGNDGTVVSTYVSTGALDWDINAPVGQIVAVNPGYGLQFNFNGAQNDFNHGEAPSAVAIDPNGVGVSIHQTNDRDSQQLYANVGSASGGTIGFGGGIALGEQQGTCPSIAAIGPGQFLVSCVQDTSPPSVYMFTLSVSGEAGNWSVQTGRAFIDCAAIASENGSQGLNLMAATPSNSCPRLSYCDGVLLVSNVYMTTSPNMGYAIGTFAENTFVALAILPRLTTVSGTPSSPLQAGAIGPNNAICIAEISGSSPYYTVACASGVYVTGDSWSFQMGATNPNLNWTNDETAYPCGVDIDFIDTLGLNGVVMTVRDASENLSLCYVQV
jgi:hypothetical protein